VNHYKASLITIEDQLKKLDEIKELNATSPTPKKQRPAMKSPYGSKNKNGKHNLSNS